MRRIVPPVLEKCRIMTGPYATEPGSLTGAYLIVDGGRPLPEARRISASSPYPPPLLILASDPKDEGETAQGWEHVSVSTKSRCPTWEEMCFVKELFWLPEELVVQYHMPAAENVNIHDYCLHLWRNIYQTYPTPPSIFVGPP